MTFVDVCPDTRVIDISLDGVTTATVLIPVATVIWAAGVAAAPLGAQLGTQTDRSG